MKKIAILAAVITLTAFFVGCGKATNPISLTNPTGTSNEGVENLAGLMEAQQKVTETYDPNDPAVVAKMMENYARLGAQMELNEFEKVESVDAPSGFPSSLIYGKGKVTESSDTSNEFYLDKDITIQTTDDLKTVKDFYKSLLSAAPWKITSQSSESSGASYTAKDAANFEASVDISSDPYSKIVNIYVSYSREITE